MLYVILPYSIYLQFHWNLICYLKYDAILFSMDDVVLFSSSEKNFEQCILKSRLIIQWNNA